VDIISHDSPKLSSLAVYLFAVDYSHMVFTIMAIVSSECSRTYVYALTDD
jgi:hypothetical protein